MSLIRWATQLGEVTIEAARQQARDDDPSLGMRASPGSFKSKFMSYKTTQALVKSQQLEPFLALARADVGLTLRVRRTSFERG